MQATRIPVWHTFLNWIIAVIAGSIVWPLIMTLFKGGPGGADDIARLMAISAILSAATSLPAMLLLLLANVQLNKASLPRSRYHLIHIGVHIGVAILTFFVIFLFIGREMGKDFFPFLVIALTYTTVGVTTWAITFAIHKNKQVNRTELREDILDEL